MASVESLLPSILYCLCTGSHYPLIIAVTKHRGTSSAHTVRALAWFDGSSTGLHKATAQSGFLFTRYLAYHVRETSSKYILDSHPQQGTALSEVDAKEATAPNKTGEPRLFRPCNVFCTNPERPFRALAAGSRGAIVKPEAGTVRLNACYLLFILTKQVSPKCLRKRTQRWLTCYDKRKFQIFHNS